MNKQTGLGFIGIFFGSTTFGVSTSRLGREIIASGHRREIPGHSTVRLGFQRKGETAIAITVGFMADRICYYDLY